MGEVAGSKSWREELASLVEDTGIIFTSGDAIGVSAPAYHEKTSSPDFVEAAEVEMEPESVKDQIKGFAAAWGEMVVELGKGLRDVVQQTLLTEDSYIVRKTRGPLNEVSERLKLLNEFLPEDRHPVHAWPVIFFVFLLAMAALNVNSTHERLAPVVKKVYIPPPSAVRILLPDGRYLAYHEIGVAADRARFSVLAPHGFLSSRLGGMSRSIQVPLLEEFGVRLVTYDLPGFGESDHHSNRSLSSSALDMLHLTDALGISDKFWVWGYSSGAIHAWAALRYIPSRIAGAAMFAPLVNPYDSSMTKEEMSKTWENWTRRRKFMYYLARRFPKFLNSFYRQTFLSGKHGHVEKWLSLSLGEKDKYLIGQSIFEEFWHKDVAESIRQGSTIPFLNEAALQVSNWGFSLADLQVRIKCPGRGIFVWFKFIYNQAECELAGFPGPVHIWQGTDDHVVPESMADYIARVLPDAAVHKLPGEGHFSYFFFCDECHRQMLSTLFGRPQGPVETTDEIKVVASTKEEEDDADDGEKLLSIANDTAEEDDGEEDVTE